MKKQKKEISKRKGVLTVEAAIVLPVFIMVMFFVLSIMKLFYFHLVMQQSLQNVGRTLAQYGYVIDDLIGLEKFSMEKETAEAEAGLKQGVDAVITDSRKLISHLQGKLTLETVEAVLNDGKEFAEHLNELGGTLELIKKNPTIIVNYLLVSAMNEAGGEFVRWMIGDYLDNMQASNGTISNLQYSLFVDAQGEGSRKVSGTKDIILIVDYDYSLPFFFFDKIRIRQQVRVHPWVGGPSEGVDWK